MISRYLLQTFKVDFYYVGLINIIILRFFFLFHIQTAQLYGLTVDPEQDSCLSSPLFINSYQHLFIRQYFCHIFNSLIKVWWG